MKDTEWVVDPEVSDGLINGALIGLGLFLAVSWVSSAGAYGYQAPFRDVAPEETYSLKLPHEERGEALESYRQRQEFRRAYMRSADLRHPRLERARPKHRSRSLGEAIGLQEDGTVQNPASKLFTFEMDSVGAYVFDTQALKLGVSFVLFKQTFDSGKGWRAGLDVFNEMLGASVRYTFAPVLRPSIGLGYGTFFGLERDLRQAAGKSTESIYVDFTIRLW